MIRAKSVCAFGYAVLALSVAVTAASHGSQAQQVVQGVGTWDSTVQAAQGETVGRTYSDEQLAAIEKVSTYFNGLTTLTGRFVQTDPNQKQMKGRVYVAKPGRFRFEYARPSRKVVISDGRFLAIQNRDLQTDETYELDNTPFRMLLADDVNLLRDADVLQVDVEPAQIALILRDKNPDAAGAIKVVLATGEDVVLQGWITRDAQGLETKVELFGVKHGESLRPKLFEREKLFMNQFR